MFQNDWRKKDNFSRARHQELVERLNLDAIITATGELEIGAGGGRGVIDSRSLVVEEIFFGQVVDTGPNGESDYASGDPRYFVQRLMPFIAATVSDPPTMEIDPNPESEMTSDTSGNVVVDDIVTATSVAAAVDPGRTLNVDDPVTVTAVHTTKDGKTYKLYLILPGGGGGVSLLQNGTNVISNTPFINMSSTRGTNNILMFATDVVSGTHGAKLAFNTLGSNRTVLQVSAGGNVVWDYVRFHS